MFSALIDTPAGSLQKSSRSTQRLSTGKTQARAATLAPADRKDLAVAVLSRSRPVTRLADVHDVSRTFLYRQTAKARAALEGAFDPPPEAPKVLFNLPVTHDWLHQFAVAQILIGPTSYRGVGEILEAVFGRNDLSVGTVGNLVAATAEKARAINAAQSLEAIRVGAHDEIFQGRKPVLVGADVDVKSTYCYLLAAEDHRDETTWGVHLLDLAERGWRPEHTIADGGSGLRAGQRAACPGMPCHGDVFHAERDLGAVAFYLQRRAAGCTAAREKLERKMDRARGHCKGRSLSKRLAIVRQAERRAVGLAGDIAALADWMQNDILSVAGDELATRRELFDFIVEPLAQRENLCPHRIRPVRRSLERPRDGLLAFVAVNDERFADLAIHLDVPLYRVHAVCELEARDPNRADRWQREAQLRKKLPDGFHRVQNAVRDILAETVRASSRVENLNGRLRNYFFLRRHIGNDYLERLQFFLNHRRFIRSDRPERTGKSPTELMTGREHAHWLELLGYQRFTRN